MPSYKSYSGSDIVATFAGRPIGSLLSINWSSTREKAPNYVMGDPNPKGFARGRRGIAGSLVFAVFDKNALLYEMRNRDDNHKMKKMKFQSFAGGKNGERFPIKGAGAPADSFQPDQFNEYLSRATNNEGLIETVQAGARDVKYADQIMPFDITINMANETGDRSKISLYDVEILNQGMGVASTI